MQRQRHAGCWECAAQAPGAGPLGEVGLSQETRWVAVCCCAVRSSHEYSLPCERAARPLAGPGAAQRALTAVRAACASLGRSRFSEKVNPESQDTFLN